MAETNNKGKILSTRIALRIDSERNWIDQGSEKPLMPGEIAMSYGGAEWDSENKTYRYKSFKFKVGARDHITGRLLKWNELKEVELASLDPEVIEQIVDEVEERFANQFTKLEDFNAFKTKVEEQVVTGWTVSDGECLSLLRGLSAITDTEETI